MSEADVARLFRIDVDVRTISPHPEKGSGLGLILCHELITKTGGEIKVESSVGIGSKFIINLPVQIAD
jgi:signal transduction histidine kinase